MAAIWNSAILNLAILYCAILIFSFKLTQTCKDWFPPFSQNISLIHSDSTWWWQPSWLPPCWIQTLPSWSQTPCYLLSDSLKNTLTPLWLWLKLIQSDSNSLIFTLLDDGGHLEFGHLGFSNLSISFQSHSHLPRLVLTNCTKKLHSFSLTQPDDGSQLKFCHFAQKNFTHSFWLNLMMAAILNPDILNLAMLDSAIIVFPLKLTHTCQDWFPPFPQKKLHSISLTQLDDGSQLKFCHVGFIHFAKKKTSIFHSH